MKWDDKLPKAPLWWHDKEPAKFGPGKAVGKLGQGILLGMFLALLFACVFLSIQACVNSWIWEVL